VRYVRKLTTEDRCRIVGTEVPARVEYALVCDRHPEDGTHAE
jgi:hypothetical protein